MEDSPEPEYVITLIHGTFARNAPWVHNPASFLRRQLAEQLAPATVAFDPFVWSGKNSHLARLRGALALRRFLRDQARRFPRAQRVLVAHSHGGNVAAYALRDAATTGRVARVVCMGTPFIGCTPAHLPTVARERRRLLTFGLVLMALPLLMTREWFRGWPAVGAVAGAYVAARLAGWWLFSPTGPVVRRWKHLQCRLVRRLAAPDPIRVPFLCAVTQRDEARAVLTAVGLVARLTRRVMWVVRWGAVSLFALLLVGGSVAIYANRTTIGNSLESLLLTGFLVAMGLLALAGLLFVFVAVRAVGPAISSFVSWVVRGAGYGGGIGPGAFSLMTTEQALRPGGAADVTEEMFNLRDTFRDWFRLQHSRLYESECVLGTVSTWIRSRAPVPPGGAARAAE